MPEEYRVVSHNGLRPWSSKKGGSFVDHNLTVQIGDRMIDVVRTTKPETPDPQPGEVIYGHLETQEVPKKDGTTFTKTKLKPDQRDSGPPAISQNAGRDVRSQAPSQSGGGAAQTSYWDEKDARIEWAWACNLAAAELGPGCSHKDVVERARKIRDHARQELSPQQPNSSISPTQAAAGAGAREGAPAPAKPFQEASKAQKGAVTRVLRQGHASDELIKRLVYAVSGGETLSFDGARLILDTCTSQPAQGVNDLIQRFDVERPSDIPYEPENGDAEAVWDYSKEEDGEQIPF